MLPKYFRFHAVNASGQLMTYANDARILVTYIPWKFTNGALEYGDEVTDNMGFTTGTLADGVNTEGDIHQNGTLKFLGLTGTFKVIHDLAAAAGAMYLMMESSTDGTTWPSDSGDEFAPLVDLKYIKTLTLDPDQADEARSVNFSL